MLRLVAVAQRLGVRWQSASGDTAFGWTGGSILRTVFVPAKAAWRCASRRSPRHARANQSESAHAEYLNVPVDGPYKPEQYRD